MNSIAKRRLDIDRLAQQRRLRGFVIEPSKDQRNSVDQELIDYLKDPTSDLYDQEAGRELEHKSCCYKYWNDKFDQNIYDDLYTYTDGDQLLSKCATGYASNMSLLASSYPAGQGTYCILINHGISTIINKISGALLLANKERLRDSEEYFRLAISAFYNLSVEEYGRIVAATHEGSTVKDSAEIGKVTAIVLIFIALHEFGHIKKGHVDIPTSLTTKTSFPGTPQPQPSETLDTLHSQEFEADSYAFECLRNHCSSPETLCNDILFVCFFLLFIHHIEKSTGKVLSPEHPDPLLRVFRLIEMISKACSESCNGILLWMFTVYNYLTESFVMNSIALDIQTGDADSVLKQFGQENIIDMPGFQISLKGQTARRGMTESDVIISIVISFATNIPCGLISNYLHETFLKGNDSYFVANDEALFKQKEIEDFIARRTTGL